jgi:hypothetical protein
VSSQKIPLQKKPCIVSSIRLRDQNLLHWTAELTGNVQLKKQKVNKKYLLQLNIISGVNFFQSTLRCFLFVIQSRLGSQKCQIQTLRKRVSQNYRIFPGFRFFAFAVFHLFAGIGVSEVPHLSSGHP